MDVNTKKYLMYGAGAILVGSLGYFIYTVATKKPFNVDNTQLSIGKDDTEEDSLQTPTDTNEYGLLFKSMLEDSKLTPSSIGYKFPTAFSLT